MTDSTDLTIGQLAAAVGVSARTIRHYDSIGLVNSTKIARNRCFSEQSLAELALIKDLIELGFSLREVGILLRKDLRPSTDFHMDGEAPSRDMLIKRLALLQGQIAQVSIQLRDYD